MYKIYCVCSDCHSQVNIYRNNLSSSEVLRLQISDYTARKRLCFLGEISFTSWNFVLDTQTRPSFSSVSSFVGGDWLWRYSLPKYSVDLRAWFDWKTKALPFSGTWKTFFVAAACDLLMLPDTHVLCEWHSHTSSSHCVVTAWVHYKQSVHGCKNTAYHLLIDHVNKSYHHFISYLVWCTMLWISWTRLEQVSYLQQMFAHISNAIKNGFCQFSHTVAYEWEEF